MESKSSKLTARQQEIRNLVAAGKKNQEIADLLSISVSTVKNTMKLMFDKIGASTRTELVYMTKP